MPTQRQYPQFDFSGAVQSATSHLLKKVNEVYSAKNAVFNEVLGSATRRKGYEQVGTTIQHGKDGLYAGVYRYGLNNKIMAGVNNSGDTAANLRFLDTGGYWTNVITDAAPNTRFNCLNSQGEFYVAGFSDNNTYYPLTLIDQTLTARRDYNVLNAPKCKFVTEFQGDVYVLGCEVNGVKYPQRAYRSSPLLGQITFVQTDQKGLLNQLRVDAVTYLKPGMQVDVYGANSNNKKVAALTIISVYRNNTGSFITFTPTTIDVLDNDELWLTGRKGKLTRFWNTDWPNIESAESIDIPVAEDSENIPEITGYGKNNGRLFMTTADSFYKWDGGNLTAVSESIGCVAPESIKNIGKWTLFFHTTGVWGYNDDTGQLQLLSKAVDRFIRAIKSTNYKFISAVTMDRVYKISIGELNNLDLETTSTSTSSTSTSSTSSSTSSTSTSSTSTSSTSVSTSSTSTSFSTSSTSTSTTSTSSTSVSTSSTSTSVSTSTSSTTTTTSPSTKEVYRLCYDFDSNSWWVETHKREHRFQFRHRMHGYKKPYFIDETGRMFRDETTNKDHFDTIPFEVEWGRDNFGSELNKNYHSVTTDADRMEATVLMASIDGGQYKTVGQLTQKIQEHTFKFGTSGHDISYKYLYNDDGNGPIINGQITFWSPLESLGSSG